MQRTSRTCHCSAETRPVTGSLTNPAPWGAMIFCLRSKQARRTTAAARTGGGRTSYNIHGERRSYFGGTASCYEGVIASITLVGGSVRIGCAKPTSHEACDRLLQSSPKCGDGVSITPHLCGWPDCVRSITAASATSGAQPVLARDLVTGPPPGVPGLAGPHALREVRIVVDFKQPGRRGADEGGIGSRTLLAARKFA